MSAIKTDVTATIQRDLSSIVSGAELNLFSTPTAVIEPQTPTEGPSG